MKSIVKTTALSLGLVSLLLVGVNAQDLPSRGPIAFSVYDVNNDGFISKKEFYDVRDKRMQEKAAQGMPMKNASNAPSFSAFDKDGDGKLTELELLKGQNMQMMKHKANKGNKGFQKGMQ